MDKSDIKKDFTPNVLSLFSGCGGLDLGFAQAGYNLAVGTDMDAWCAESHRRNFPDTHFYEAPISEFIEALPDVFIDLAEKIDVVIGGPPCPPFSKSRFYRKEKPRSFKDPSAEETVSAYMDIVEKVEPCAFLFENVHGFFYKKHKDALSYVLNRANEAGFNCSHMVLNAANYGVPQIRERFFLVGMRNGHFSFPDPTHSKDAAESLLVEGKPWVTAGEVLTDLDTEDNADDAGHYAGGKHHHLLREVPPGDNYLFFTKERGHPNPQFIWRSRYWSFLLKLSPSMPSWTIQARRSNNMGPFHWRNRILRIEEVRRIQTFPDDWYLSGNVERQWRQIGNAVPPLLSKQLAMALKIHLKERNAVIA